MNREYHKWHSPALQREMELLVFGHAGTRMLVFPTRKQRFYEYEDHGMVHSLREPIEEGRLQLFCVDGIDEDSLYCFDKEPEERILRHLDFERYVLEEVIPFSQKTNPEKQLIAHGCSFGAYHAAAIALRHPKKFHRVLAFSGRYDLTLHAGDFFSLFHGYYSDELRSIMPSHFVPHLTDEKLLRAIRRIKFTFVCGDEDPFYHDNVFLHGALLNQNVKSKIHAWCGNAHRFRYWRQMIRIYL